ncbi:MAG TPA: response regulator transcription factor [Bacteroidales bacterium]|nr:response regulator transcription factor [Bacteroidales bacterium]
MSGKIFFVEDDHNFGAVMKSFLEMNGFSVDWVANGTEALKKFTYGVYDLCIIDVMLPGIDGFTLASEIRKIESDIHLFFMTARRMKEDIMKGFKIGADDYIIKPFDTEVFLYKVKAAIRRSNNLTKKPEIIMIGKYEFNPVSRRISFYGKEQKLSPKEAALLQLLCEHQNEVLPREKALKIIWGDDNYFTARSMDVFITKLRKYLKDDKNIAIENIHSSGYRLIVGGNIK